jgi:hypothetical protein
MNLDRSSDKWVIARVLAGGVSSARAAGNEAAGPLQKPAGLTDRSIGAKA